MYVNFLSTYSDKKSCHTSITLQTSIARFVSDSWASCLIPALAGRLSWSLFEFSTPTETIPFPSSQTSDPGHNYTLSHKLTSKPLCSRILFWIDAFLVLYIIYIVTQLAQALCSWKVLIVQSSWILQLNASMLFYVQWTSFTPLSHSCGIVYVYVCLCVPVMFMCLKLVQLNY